MRLALRLLNRHEARNHSQAFHSRTSPPHARCLTFAIAAARLGRAASRVVAHHGRGALTTRARVGRSTTSHVATQSNRPGNSTIPARAGQASNVCRSRGELTGNLVVSLLALAVCDWLSAMSPKPGLTEPPPASQVPARFGPRTATDSVALRLLHSTALHLRKLQFRSVAFRQSQTAETVTDQTVCARKSPNGRDAPHVAQVTAVRPRGFARPTRRH